MPRSSQVSQLVTRRQTPEVQPAPTYTDVVRALRAFWHAERLRNLNTPETRAAMIEARDDAARVLSACPSNDVLAAMDRA